MELVKLLEDMDQKIKEVKELLATFRALQLELEPLAMPTLERSDNERFAVQSQFDKSSLVSQGRNLALSQSLIPEEPTKFADALEMVEPKKRGRKKKVQA